MKTYYELVELENVSITFGFFDGLHIGHKRVLSSLVSNCKLNGSKSAVLVFTNNKEYYFDDNLTPNIQSFKDVKIDLENMGIDYVLEVDFEQFKNMTAKTFLEDVIIKYFNPVAIITGRSYVFGCDFLGDNSFLKNNEKAYNYTYVDVIEKTSDDLLISSKEIKNLILDGDLSNIKSLLGRNFSLYNSVIRGNKKSSIFCLPTANVIWPDSIIKLPYGVYLGYCQIDNKVNPALISWSNRPTLTTGTESFLEIHIADFKGDLSGKLIKIIFVKQLRDIEKFASPLLLKTRILTDNVEFKKWVKASL